MAVRKTTATGEETTAEAKAAKPATKKAAGTAATKKTSTAAKKAGTTTKKAATTARKTTAAAKKAPATRAKSTTRTASSGGSAAGKDLIIVESPAKAKTLQKYLGSGFKIEASVGHVKDLPTSKMGVDLENGFKPEYIITKGKEKVIDRIRQNAAVANKIYLAPDPDREGEAIAWHLASELQDLGVSDRIYRATFNEITRKAVQDALDNPRTINESLFEAQQARRILDRIVGYKISPLLWKKVMKGLSAGRVQSVAVRLIVERDREIKAFIPEEYWSLEAGVAGPNPPPFTMKLSHINGSKAEIATEDQVRELLQALEASDVEVVEQAENDATTGRRNADRRRVRATTAGRWTVSRIEKKDVKRRPAPPFITSTLQQEASRRFGFGAKRTMSIAQRLYEGVELGGMGHTALITYMRTDSTRISPDAINAVREHIRRTFGDTYLPDSPNFWRTKKSAQDAHECIRPTDMSLTPDSVAAHLEPEQLKLYTVVWNRFVACQMAEAIFEQTRIEARPTEALLFAATGLVQKFAGYLAVYEEGKDDQTDDGDQARLPKISEGDELDVSELRGNQHFTQPPPRYTEASLVKELEKQGIGRPSTYATIVTVIQEKKYVEKDDSKRFLATELGHMVTDLLVDNFPGVLNVGFTAEMEERLDAVEEGTQNWQELLGEFYQDFSKQMDAATENMKSVKQQVTPTDILCDKCGEATMVVKLGRNGQFLACPRFPACKNAKPFKTTETGEIVAVAQEVTDEPCPNCGKMMIVRSGRNGRFMACPDYPECKTALSMKTGVKCPECKTGDLVERVGGRNKKMFFACSNYPECKHILNYRPVLKECPSCHNPFLTERLGKLPALVCPVCKHKEELETADEQVSTSN